MCWQCYVYTNVQYMYNDAALIACKSHVNVPAFIKTLTGFWKLLGHVHVHTGKRKRTECECNLSGPYTGQKLIRIDSNQPDHIRKWFRPPASWKANQVCL